MASVALWWSALVLGTVLLGLAGVVPTVRAFRGRRVPRLGFAPPRERRTPWWSYGSILVGTFLMALASGELSESPGGSLAYFGGAGAVCVLVQTIVIAWHNRQQRNRPGALQTTPPSAGAGPAAL